MTFSGDHLEPKSPWSKARSFTILGLIVLFFTVLIINPSSRGYALVGLAILVTIMFHEAGHFIAAKWAKMKATEFFVGFGPRIWSFHRGETEYGIKAIPLGGYVKIIGMTNLDEVHEDDEHRTYRKGQTRKKLVVIMAGGTVNILLAYLLFFSYFVGHGQPLPRENARAVIESSNPGSPAAKIGLKPGDEIVKIDGKSISTFEQLATEIADQKVGETVSITYVRDGEKITKSTKLISNVNSDGSLTNTPILGVTQAAEYERMGVLPAAGRSAEVMLVIVKSAGTSVSRLFSPSGISSYSKTVVKGDYERQDRPSSVAGIVNTGGEIVNQNLWDILWLIAAINIFLALFNALPLLPLDGGHAAVAIYERIASKFKKREVQADFKKLMPIAVVVIGIMVLFSLTSLWLDILQIAS